MINAVLIPVIRKEIADLKSWLSHCPDPGGLPFTLFMSIDNQWTSSEKQALAAVVEASRLAGQCKAVFIDCEIPEEQSFYQKDNSNSFDIEKYPYGKKSGPNIQFFRSIRKAMASAPALSSVLLLETDAHPVRRNWLVALNQSTQWLTGHVLIAGSHPVWGETAGLIRKHINGNAIYFTSDPAFEVFLTQWEQLLLGALKLNCKLAYDVVLEWSYNYYNVNSVNNEYLARWKQLVETDYKYKIVDVSRYIANLSGIAAGEASADGLDLFLRSNPDLQIVHGKCRVGCGDIFQARFWARDPGRLPET